MKKILLLAFGCLIALPSLSQSDFSDFYELWKFAPGKTTPLTLQTKGYTRIVLEPVDTATWIYTITRTKKIWGYDSTATDINNNSPSITYVGTWAYGAAQTKFFNQDFQYGNPVGVRTATFTTTLDKPGKICLYSERFAGHGLYTVKVDSDPVVEINAGIAPLGSDKDRDKPSFRSKLLQPGTHTFIVSTSQQMVIDLIRVTKYTPK